MIRNAKLWCDVESAEEAKYLSKQWDYNLVPGFTASKILWLKENEPENFAKLRHVLLPHDYINYYLTGRYAMEVRGTDTLSTILLPATHPEMFFTSSADYLPWRLQAKCVAAHLHLLIRARCWQCGDASGTGVWDTQNRCFSESRLNSIDSNLHSYMPELIGPNEVCAAPRACLRYSPFGCAMFIPLQLVDSYGISQQ